MPRPGPHALPMAQKRLFFLLSLLLLVINWYEAVRRALISHSSDALRPALDEPYLRNVTVDSLHLCFPEAAVAYDALLPVASADRSVPSSASLFSDADLTDCVANSSDLPVNSSAVTGKNATPTDGLWFGSWSALNRIATSVTTALSDLALSGIEYALDATSNSSSASNSTLASFFDGIIDAGREIMDADRDVCFEGTSLTLPHAADTAARHTRRLGLIKGGLVCFLPWREHMAGNLYRLLANVNASDPRECILVEKTIYLYATTGSSATLIMQGLLRTFLVTERVGPDAVRHALFSRIINNVERMLRDRRVEIRYENLTWIHDLPAGYRAYWQRLNRESEEMIQVFKALTLLYYGSNEALAAGGVLEGVAHTLSRVFNEPSFMAPFSPHQALAPRSPWTREAHDAMPVWRENAHQLFRSVAENGRNQTMLLWFSDSSAIVLAQLSAFVHTYAVVDDLAASGRAFQAMQMAMDSLLRFYSTDRLFSTVGEDQVIGKNGGMTGFSVESLTEWLLNWLMRSMYHSSLGQQMVLQLNLNDDFLRQMRGQTVAGAHSAIRVVKQLWQLFPSQHPEALRYKSSVNVVLSVAWVSLLPSVVGNVVVGGLCRNVADFFRWRCFTTASNDKFIKILTNNAAAFADREWDFTLAEPPAGPSVMLEGDYEGRIKDFWRYLREDEGLTGPLSLDQWGQMRIAQSIGTKAVRFSGTKYGELDALIALAYKYLGLDNGCGISCALLTHAMRVVVRSLRQALIHFYPSLHEAKGLSVEDALALLLLAAHASDVGQVFYDWAEWDYGRVTEEALSHGCRQNLLYWLKAATLIKRMPMTRQLVGLTGTEFTHAFLLLANSWLSDVDFAGLYDLAQVRAVTHWQHSLAFSAPHRLPFLMRSSGKDEKKALGEYIALSEAVGMSTVLTNVKCTGLGAYLLGMGNASRRRSFNVEVLQWMLDLAGREGYGDGCWLEEKLPTPVTVEELNRVLSDDSLISWALQLLPAAECTDLVPISGQIVAVPLVPALIRQSRRFSANEIYQIVNVYSKCNSQWHFFSVEDARGRTFQKTHSWYPSYLHMIVNEEADSVLLALLNQAEDSFYDPFDSHLLPLTLHQLFMEREGNRRISAIADALQSLHSDTH